MCGISAIINIKTDHSDGTIKHMVEQLRHRGPDARGYKYFKGCHMGHARLSIIDLKTGSQPMSDANENYGITFNGEIYNYKELREQLCKNGYNFKTSSDTEVILAAYIKFGIQCLDKFRGMFAFAIWNSDEQKLFAARDIFGEKPLYYTETDNGLLIIASEIKALLASGMLKPRINPSAVDAYLTFGYVPPDRTIYENITALPPGHYLEWEKGRVTVERYWKPYFKTNNISLDQAAEVLEELLKQAVKRQMVSDVPVGAFLSGGLDSSTIVALMQQQALRSVKTFSVGFGKLINELPYARAVANLYNTEHYEIDLGMPMVAELLGKMVCVYDEPFADSSQIPTYLISEFARKQVKVVLTGDGGDELFGGYGWYLALAASEKASSNLIKWIVMRIASRIIKERNRKLQVYSIAMGLSNRWSDMWTRNVMSNIYFKAEERHILWHVKYNKLNSFMPGEYFKPDDDVSGLNRSFYFDLTSYLPGDILVKVDRASMAHGLEARSPFLDRDLVEFALSLPSALKISGDQTKVVLHQACRKYWPIELHSRNKQGFGAPYSVWLGQPEVQALTNRVFSNGSPLRLLLPGLKKENFLRPTYQKWILLILGLWLEKYSG